MNTPTLKCSALLPAVILINPSLMDYFHGKDHDGHGKFDRILRGRPTLGESVDADFEDDDGDDLENFKANIMVMAK